MTPLWLTVIMAVVGPVVAGVVLFAIQRAARRIDERAESAERAAYTTHVVLRELVRAARDLGARMDLPRGW